jgi:transposase InsO family protein
MCEVLAVSKSRYYDYINHKPSRHELDEIELTTLIRDIWLDSSMRYGAPKIDAILRKNHGKTVGIKRIQRIMAENDIKSITVKKFRPTKYIPSPNIERDNLLKRDFNATRKNEKWVSDITYVWTKDDGWCYLATIMDLCTKKIVGWTFGREMTTELVQQALKNAIYNEGLNTTIILHSDQGSQYTAAAYEKLCKELNTFSLSYSEKGCPYDNAPMESFNSIIKKELINHMEYKDFKEARISIFEFIEHWYNRVRIHSSIGNKSPLEFETELLYQVA